jgi:translation initiation factor IF-3
MLTYFSVNDQADPPICKFDLYDEFVSNMVKKGEKAARNFKPKGVKEIIVGVSTFSLLRFSRYMQALIDNHDLGIKMKKVRSFLEQGLQVKLTLFAKARTMVDKPFNLDQTTVKALEMVEDISGLVQPISRAHNRVEFIINPKK